MPGTWLILPVIGYPEGSTGGLSTPRLAWGFGGLASCLSPRSHRARLPTHKTILIPIPVSISIPKNIPRHGPFCPLSNEIFSFQH